MHEWTGAPAVAASTIIENNADTSVARAFWSDPSTHWVVADEPFTVGTKKYGPGTIVGASSAQASKTHELHLPRVPILHTCRRTRDERGFPPALDSLAFAHSYLPSQ